MMTHFFDEETPSISLFSESTDFKYQNQSSLNLWIEETIQEEANSFRYVNIIFCSDEFLLEMNKEHLNHDYYTDIITFQYDQKPIEGELFISIDRVKDNSVTHAVSFEQELDRVIIHGVLHLIGYGDKTEEEKIVMRSKEDYYLSRRNKETDT